MTAPELDPGDGSDLKAVLSALTTAEFALKAASEGGQAGRAEFIDQVGLALARLIALWERIGPKA
jgi:hypothetical protein